MLPRVQEYVIRSPQWGDLKVMRVIPIGGDPWGDFACLKGTAWGDFLRVVPGEALSFALHGRVTPLMQVIGASPRLTLKQMALRGPEMTSCAHVSFCLMADKHCVPGPKLPQCYEPQGFGETRHALAAGIVAKAWSNDQYVLVVEGEEFSYA